MKKTNNYRLANKQNTPVKRTANIHVGQISRSVGFSMYRTPVPNTEIAGLTKNILPEKRI